MKTIQDVQPHAKCICSWTEYISVQISALTPKHPVHASALSNTRTPADRACIYYLLNVHAAYAADKKNRRPQTPVRSSNCIRRIIKLHELHHSCAPMTGGGGEGRCGPGFKCALRSDAVFIKKNNKKCHETQESHNPTSS